jgi:enoyl-CoA hydratase/carnithine racemase
VTTLSLDPADLTQVAYSVSGAIATIALDRPEARNGYTIQMSYELAAAFRAANADSAVRVVVLTANGDDFCVGADLSGGGFGTREGQDEAGLVEPAGRCSREVFRMDKPVIAAVRGRVVGAGATIILPADFRLAAKGSRFGYVFNRRGIVPEGGSAWFLPRVVGLPRAVDWMISGRIVEADEALESGLVRSLHEPDELLPAAYALAEELVAKTSPVAVALTRRMLYELSPLTDPEAAHRVDAWLIAHCVASADAAEGVASFFERRDPQFPGTVPADVPVDVPWKA